MGEQTLEQKQQLVREFGVCGAVLGGGTHLCILPPEPPHAHDGFERAREEYVDAAWGKLLSIVRAHRLSLTYFAHSGTLTVTDHLGAHVAGQMDHDEKRLVEHVLAALANRGCWT